MCIYLVPRQLGRYILCSIVHSTLYVGYIVISRYTSTNVLGDSTIALLMCCTHCCTIHCIELNSMQAAHTAVINRKDDWVYENQSATSLSLFRHPASLQMGYAETRRATRGVRYKILGVRVC